MAFSLYDATVANYLQILGAVGGFLEKSLTHFREKGIDQAEVVETRLAPDLRERLLWPNSDLSGPCAGCACEG
jgi:hypothetical protein